jgi:hypothetical protein
VARVPRTVKRKKHKPSVDKTRPYGFMRVENQCMFDLRASDRLRQLIVAVKDVRAHRQVNAHESGESQDAWDRLALAVLESERLLEKPSAKENAHADTGRHVHRKRRG